MPYKSEAQRRYLHAKHPKIARKWDKEEKVRKSEPIFKSADPEFNHAAAKKAFDLVMKMDEDEARVFTSIVVSDITEEIIEKNLRTVQAHLNRVIAKRMQDVKKALVSKAAGNPDSIPYAQALVMFEKAQRNPYDFGYTWKESDFNRDPGTGQFRSKISHSQTKPISPKTATSMGIPERRGLDNASRAQFQDEYRQLASFLNSVTMSTRNPGDSKVLLHVENKATGQRAYVENNGTNPDPSKWNPKNERLIGVEARPNALTVGGAAFGLMPALGERGTGAINAATDRDAVRSFSDDWLGSGPGRNANDRTYGRIKAGSEYVSGIAPAGSKLQMATAFGSFVGSMGPEAERVLGPTTRKTAYRYRGTEKAPEKRLVGAYGRAIAHAKTATANDPFRGTKEGQRANLKAPSSLSPSQMAQARVAAERRAPTFEERQDGRKVIRAYLEEKIPNKRLYGLQLASGNTPPSQGVLLNKDGQIVSEAVGYGDDHYIPFNLKNLKSLKGGEYIRTRSVGGLTSEDIYVGLMTGARQVTVVSRSGTFTLTFNEDFKGGRRHNDKARRMTRRYEQILDAVQSEQVDRGDVDPRIKEIITSRVNEELGEYGTTRDKRNLVKQRIEEYKAEGGELTEEDEILINAMARAALRDGRSQDEKDYRRQVTGEILASKATRFRLDGHGYKASLEALEEQFPYYITVNAVPTDEQEVQSIERDKGYVEPGRNRPTAARAGLYGTSVNQGNKFSASQADYQGATARQRQEAAVGAAGAAGATSVAPAGGGTKFNAAEFRASPAKEKVDTTTPPPQFVPAATQLADDIKSFDLSDVSDADKAVLNYGDEELKNPGKAARFDDLVTYFNDQSANGLGDSWTRYQASKGAFGMKPYDPVVNRGHFSKHPFAFSGTAYEGKNLAAKHAELSKIDGRSPGSLFGNKKYSEMTHNELAREHSALTQMYNTLDAAGNPADPVVRANVLKSMGVNMDAPASKMLRADPGKAGDFIDDVQRVHAITHNMTPEERKPAPKVENTGDGKPNEAVSERATKLIQGLEKAAAARERAGEDSEADEFRVIAGALKDQARSSVSEADINSFIDANEDTIRRAMSAIHEGRR